MLHGPWLIAMEPQFAIRDGKVHMQTFVTLTCHRPVVSRVRLVASLSPLDNESIGGSQSRTVTLAPHETRRILLLDTEANRFDWKHFQTACRLLQDGQVVDRMRRRVDVRAVFQSVCQRLVQEQQRRGDGKFSGIGFVDNRGARALLTAYDLLGKRVYLDAAIRWGRAMIAEQRKDGGYLMGYGYYSDGNACFVADGGEIACGIARLVTYAPEPDKQLFRNSLGAYMAYRDSFRCPEGGIGVGWCKNDYKVRPVTPLKKITKVFAPEKNIYTIGCTLAAATMHAMITKDPNDHNAAVQDATWWLKRCRTTYGGAAVESASWANQYLDDKSIQTATQQFLRSKFIPSVAPPKPSRWWTTSGGRSVQGLDGLSYFYHRIEQAPNALASMMQATYHVCCRDSLSGLPRVLEHSEFSSDQWRYLNFAAISLPELLQPGITRKGGWRGQMHAPQLEQNSRSRAWARCRGPQNSAPTDRFVKNCATTPPAPRTRKEPG